MATLHLRASRGFTLLELMIVVAVVALLASVAYPSYQDSVIKGKRAQGRTALVELMQQEERYMTQRNCYLSFGSSSSAATATSSCGGVAASAVPFKFFSGDNITSSAYLLSASTCPASGGGSTPTIEECVQVIAKPVKQDPLVGDLTLTSTGVRECSGSAGPVSQTCWP